MRIVEKPRVNRQAINRSIREIPVTISEFSTGILVTPMITVRHLAFIAVIPIAAQVPIKVAMSAERNAIARVLYKALMMASS